MHVKLDSSTEHSNMQMNLITSSTTQDENTIGKRGSMYVVRANFAREVSCELHTYSILT